MSSETFNYSIGNYSFLVSLTLKTRSDSFYCFVVEWKPFLSP